MTHNTPPHIPHLDLQPGAEGQVPADLTYSGETPACPMRLPTTGAEVLVLRTRAGVVQAVSSRDFGIGEVDQDQYVTTGSAFRADNDLLRIDPPYATDLRRSFAGCFSESAIAKWRPGLEETAQALATTLLSAQQPVDLVKNYTEPFLEAAGSSTLGVARSEWPRIIHFADITLGSVTSMDERPTIEAAWEELYEYSDRLIQQKRVQPDGSIFAQVVRSMDTAGKTRDEVIHAGATLMIGFPTPQPALDVSIFELLRRPEAVRACLDNPNLWGPTVKELLRYRAHFSTFLPRIALRDAQIDDVRIPKGTVVLPSLTAAAHDPAKTACPEEFDIDQQASRNIVFGTGAHFCPGAALSRQWLEVGLKELFTAAPQLSLAVAESDIKWKSGGLPAPDTLPVMAERV